jgi:ribosomal protein S18 acetylase RimI-like enzyme
MELMHVKIRLATILDAKKMLEVNLKNLPENYPLYQWIFFLGKGAFSFVAETETGDIVGYSLALILQNSKAIIASIAVEVEYRRKSIAKKLLLNSILALKKEGVLNISLHCRVSNHAQELYKKLGFSLIETVPHYYFNPREDAYLMERKESSLL